ncbi:MAG TPA: TonB-dependent receptor [Rubrivivax sp.]|nr:TonB-dependent receptor [Rubrivivax sp.]
MTTTSPRRSRAQTLLRVTPTSAAVTTALAAMLGSSAMAQTQTPSETVTITGIRRGIESAISTKKNADSIVEAISAEDLGKLPDTSIAESMSRMTGVAAQRSAGRAQQISIRGMQPDMATSLLNNREQASTGDSRSVEFDQYPSELISGVLVYKTPQADRVNGGLSGTVNLTTVRPLDLPKRAVALSYRKNKLNVDAAGSEGDGDRYAISYVDQFADRTIGLAIGFARLDEKGGVTSRFESWGGGTATFNGATVNVPYNGFNAWADQESRERDSAAATLQFRPNKNFTSTLDFFSTKFDKVQTRTGFQAPLNDNWLTAPFTYDRPGQLTQATVSGGNATAGAFNNVRAVVRNDSIAEKDKIESFGWNNQFKLGEVWSLTADLARSTAKRNGGIIETTAGTPQAALNGATFDTVQFTSAGAFTPGLNYADRSVIRLTDVQGWGGGIATPQAGYSKIYDVKDTLDGVRLSARRDLEWGPVAGIEFGAHVSDRNKIRTFTEGRLVVPGGNPLGSVAMPGTATTNIPTPGGSINVASFDSSGAVGSIYEVVRKLHPDIYNKDWRVDEKVTSAFFKTDIDSTVAGLPVRGNVGLQVAYADQSSLGFNVDRSTCSSDTNCPAGGTRGGDKYTDFLPSLNLLTDLGNAGVVRVALSRVMARPKVDDMRASTSFSYDAALIGPNGNVGTITGAGGNPALKPFRANAFDVAYEKYFGTRAYFSVAGFYKSLSSYILNVGQPFDFTAYVGPGSGIPANAPRQGYFTRPVNGQGGSIKGVEVSVDLPLNLVTSWLDGFGAFFNHSNTSSSINISSVGLSTQDVGLSTVPLPGLSKRVTNAGLYFEKWGFSARVASRSRSDFLGEVTNETGDRRYTFIKAERITDMQIGYEIQGGWLKGLAARFEISNAGNTDYVRYRTVPSDEVERKRDGKFYQFGLNYKL